MSSKTQFSLPMAGGDEFSSWAESPLFHIERISLSFLQCLFADAPKGNFKWSEDPLETDLIITADSPVDFDVINKRPAITVVLSPASFAGLMLDNLLSADLKTGERSHSDMITGNITFNCLSSNKQESRQLAWLVARHIFIFRRYFLVAGFNDFGKNMMIGSTSSAGALVGGSGSEEVRVTSVTSPFFFQWTEKITPNSQQVYKAVEARLTVKLKEFKKTEGVEGGSPAPGLRGTAIGAQYSTQMGNLQSPFGRVRPPSIRGIPLAPVNQNSKPADPPIEVIVKP